VSAIAIAATLTGASLVARATTIVWEWRGQFENCLEDHVNSWVNAKAELLVNEDPAAGDVDDLDVAVWAVTALQDCEQQTGYSNQASEHRFSRHMARWREHINSLAQAVRERVRMD
jgi:hypothetical protein